MNFKHKHFLSTLQVETRADLESFFETAELFVPVARGEKTTQLLNGAVVASLFFEASTRTRLSFESASARLGAKTLTVTGTDLISVSKGESYEDTGRVISGYADIIVMRTPSAEITAEFVRGATKPVLNAGSGEDEHPTQALLDVYTAKRELKKRGKELNGAHITLAGDLKHGRTVHSLVKLLRLYDNITYHLIAPTGIEMPASVIQIAESAGHKVVIHAENELQAAVAQSDIIYTTRLQKERLPEHIKTKAYPDCMRIAPETLDPHAQKDVIIMHPLPRDSRAGSNDLPFPSDDPRMVVFLQADNGVPIRMALIAKTFGFTDDGIRASLTTAPWANV